MEGLMLKSKSFMENMTKTIGDNQDRIGYLESLNKQLEGTVQVKHQQTEEVTFLLVIFLRFSFLVFFFLQIDKFGSLGQNHTCITDLTKCVFLVNGPEITFFPFIGR